MQVKENGKDASAKYTMQGFEDLARVVRTKLSMYKMLDDELSPLKTRLREGVLDELLRLGHIAVTHVKVSVGDGTFVSVMPPRLDNPNNLNSAGGDTAADMAADGLTVEANDFTHTVEYKLTGASAYWFSQIVEQQRVLNPDYAVPDDVTQYNNTTLSASGVTKLRTLAQAGSTVARKWLYKLTKSPSIKAS